jgi:hypothetical protein
MRLKSIADHNRVVRLEDWTGLDLTGATDMSAIVQEWQDQAYVAGRVAMAPAGIFGLSTKVIFRAPTEGAGGARFGQQSLTPTTGAVPYTCFKNLAINDNSWMIDVETVANSRSEFGFLKGFRVHAGGLNCSLLRVLGVEAVTDGGVGHFSFEKFLWDDVCAYGGYVNLEHYGYGGLIRGVYSRAARLSAFRAYLCNALTVQGGWFGVANSSAWEFEVFSRQSFNNESVHGIIFNQPVFQSQDASSTGNGLRISENVRGVTLNTYFESHSDNTGGGAIALMVGCNNPDHESPLIPTAVNLSGADAPLNDPRYAARNIDLSGCTGGGSSNANQEGARFLFGNARGITWGRSDLNLRRVEYSKYTHDIADHPMPTITITPSLSSIQGVNLSAGVTAGDYLIPVATTTNFGVGQPVYLSLTAITDYPALHESTVAAIDPGVSVTLSTPVPTGRAATTSSILCRNKFEINHNGMAVQDALYRGGEAAVNLLPAGNFKGTTTDALIGGTIHGVKEAGVNFADGRATIATDTTVKRHGRPTLKVTRKGTVAAGTQVCRFWFYPHGNEDRIQVGVPIVVSGWYMTENVAPYNSTDFSSAANWDSPSIGLTFHNGSIETHTAVGAAFTGTWPDGGSYPVPGHWHPFIYTFTVNDPNVTKIGINFLPSKGASYSWSTDASVWFDSLGIFINPRSYQDIINGTYSHHDAAGRFNVGGTFHQWASQADAATIIADTNIYFQKGDVIEYTDPVLGGVKGQVCTTAGAGGTAVFRDFGVIA